MESRIIRIFCVVFVCLMSGMSLAEGAAPKDGGAIRAQIEEWVAFLDSEAYADRTTWAEHVVLAYEAAQGREPTPYEFQIFVQFYEEGEVARSSVLAAALCGEGTELTWEQCRSFAAKSGRDRFQATDATKATVQRLIATGPAALEAALAEECVDAMEKASFWPSNQDLIDLDPPGEAYNTYFGYLHAHCNFSDGQGTALEAYTYARDVGGMDFFSLADHGELLVFWPWEDRYGQLIDAAEQTYDPGHYATLWGFEYSNPVIGHISVLNSDDFTHTLAHPLLCGFYQWLNARPAAFAQFNHPAESNFYGMEMLSLPCYTAVRDQMVGMELWSGSSNFDQFYYGISGDGELTFWDTGNGNGWYIGALGAQDNHFRTWGTKNDYRIGVLAKALTREDLVEAFFKRRFYATEDKDLVLDFRSSGYLMGSRLSDEARVFQVNATDGSGDSFAEVRLYRNGVLIEVQAVEGNSIEASFVDMNGVEADYYYVIVQQTDDHDGKGRNDEAISSPIWFDRFWKYQPGCVGVPAATLGGGGGDLFGALVLALILAALLLMAGWVSGTNVVGNIRGVIEPSRCRIRFCILR